ncbi:MAG: tryptophan synthase subunit alpha [Kiritimatiellae bacterium]|nr:tryptophan synthase subunit alpha [Kiritimatiellia bacterium]
MSGRIGKCFARAKSEGRGAFIAYLTVGYPDMATFGKGVDDLVESGADILELGVPFSDPFADGAVIRSAAAKAVADGVGMEKTLEEAGRIRERHPDAGIVLFSYYNPIFSMGTERFASEAAKAGVDAVLAVDLPLEERDELLDALKPCGLTMIPLIAPNTPLERVKESAEGIDDGFLYVITVKGITGERRDLPAELSSRLDSIRAAVAIPVAAGFGVSTGAQAETISKHADGYIVGSALVKRLGETGSLKGGLS